MTVGMLNQLETAHHCIAALEALLAAVEAHLVRLGWPFRLDRPRPQGACGAVRQTGAGPLKTLYLHIGRGKTGTTAQQAYLGHNRDALLAAGIDYLLTGDRRRGVGHQEFAKSFIADPPGYMIPAANPQEIRAETAAEIRASTAPTLLLSSENFPLVDLDALKAWIGAVGVDLQVKVIFFVRSQDELAESEYNQIVKLKRETRPPRHLCRGARRGRLRRRMRRLGGALRGREHPGPGL